MIREEWNKDIDGTWRIKTSIYMVHGELKQGYMNMVHGELKQGYTWYMEN
jgi:hypothetical protein